MDESNSILFGPNKMHTTIFARATNEFQKSTKISKNVIFQNMHKNLLKSKFQVLGVFFKSTRPVYYQLDLDLILNFN